MRTTLREPRKLKHKLNSKTSHKEQVEWRDRKLCGLWRYSPASLLILSLAGCNALEPRGDTTAGTDPEINAAALAAVSATPTPRPTPTPDPQSIPKWAHGKILHDVPVRSKDKVFALTFDDGPWPDYTGQILKILAEHNVKATFFMVGQEVRARPAVARAVRDAGHAVGSHSWDHPSRPRNAAAQIQRTDDIIEKTLGFRTTTFRPPYGMLKNGMARQAMAKKDAVLIWSADSNDWKKPGSGRIASNVINQATPGGIALMHDGGGDRYQTVAALPRIISNLKQRGYRFVTIPELLRLRYINPNPPKTSNKQSSSSKGKTKRSKKRQKKQ